MFHEEKSMACINHRANNKLIIMRGICGSGKSTKAKEIAKDCGAIICSSDGFFIIEGEYKFDPNQLDINHQLNLEKVRRLLIDGKSVIVDNTNTTMKEIKPYIEIAETLGIPFSLCLPDWTEQLYIIEDGIKRWNVEFLKGKNNHNVPDSVVQAMADRFEW